MMIVLAWLIYCVLIAGLLAAGASAWEGAARWSGRPARWGWLMALTGSVTLPWLLRLVPERGWPELVSGVPMLLMQPLTLSAGAGSAGGVTPQGAALALWASASLLVLGYLCVVLMQIARARRQWRLTEVDGAPVFVTGGMGPGAVGVRNVAVAVPAWVLDLDAGLRALLLRHERAHVEAGDPRLLFAGLVLLAAMPWNPVVWLQLLRLRNAIELDCDARVLATGADPRGYGSLLLEVGRRRSSHAFVMATFAEPHLFLEQRIRRIAQWPLERRPGRAALFTTAALMLVAGALSCDPVRVTEHTEAIPVDTRTAAAPSDSAALSVSRAAEPVFTPMTRRPELLNRDEVSAVVKNSYPPLLRDAGISGVPTVHFYIDAAGVVQRVQSSKSSGYPALDEAALHVARVMRFSPAYNRDESVAVWVEIPIVFSVAGAESHELKRDNVERNLEIIRRAQARRGEGVARRIDSAAQAMGIPPRTGERDARRPPPIGRALAAKPYFTPMTQRPELLNRDEVSRVLMRSYPPLLRDAGIGGSPTIFFFIDASGTVLTTQLSKSSGYPALDEAGLAVARAMRFTPAKNRDRDVPVWVEIPIVFTPK